ncbi:MAG: site-specific integrase [Deltaproteobacteria bacterium]|jgi:integrase|nr:site-specific integrase [Deltaproteobacteria bacterium]
MGVLAECPNCHRKQSTRNKVCTCNLNLDKSKQSKKVRYWISYRINGKQKRESIGFKISVAKDADAKRKVQKRENRIFDIKLDSKMTFNELTSWYLKLAKVQALASYPIIKIRLSKFNQVFGNWIISNVKLADLENYQAMRLQEGYACNTVDHDIKKTQTMVIKAFDNDMVSGDILKVFKRCKQTLKKGSDVRDRILTIDEFESIKNNLLEHFKPIFATAYYTGMRKSEIFGLTWDKLNLKSRVIKLEACDTKNGEPRSIPICDKLYEVLNKIPVALHGGHVFLKDGIPLKGILCNLIKACEKAGVIYGRYEKGGFVFHDLRHTFVTNMRKSGVSESVIMDIVGHSTRSMFDRYNKIDSEDTKAAIDIFGKYLDNSVDQSVDQVKVNG